MNDFNSFATLDLGTGQPTSVPMETVDVIVSGDVLLKNYSTAFVREAERVAPLRAQTVQLTSDEVVNYVDYLLTKRIECLTDDCKDWRKLKNLYIPSYIQYILSQIGIVLVRDFGLKLNPIIEKPSTMTFEEAIIISDKIGAFEDCLQMVKDAMPRSKDGNLDVMSCALVNGYVRSFRKAEHVSSTYAAAFANMKLVQESAFKALYRVQYDDLEFIASALTMQKGLY